MRCNTQKAQGRESAISLPVSNECSPKLLQAISDYSLHASYCWRRLSTITIMFFEWCVHHGRVPPLDGKYYWNANEQQYKWTKAKSRNQTLFRNMMVLRTYRNKPAGSQTGVSSILFGRTLGSPMHLQHNAACIRIPRCGRVWLTSTETMLSRGFFNRQEHLASELGKYYE